MAVGVDMSGSMFPDAGDAVRLPLAIARAEELPFPDCFCDGVLCECVLSVVKEPKRVVREFSRVLRAGGCMILSDIYDSLPASVQAEAPADSNGSQSRLRSMAFVERLLEDAGFEMLLWEDHTSHLKVLAAQLVLCGASGAGVRELCGYFASGCSGAQSRTVSPGYFLLVARKMTKGETCHG
jgi:SAM-dependent methyltransferase